MHKDERVEVLLVLLSHDRNHRFILVGGARAHFDVWNQETSTHAPTSHIVFRVAVHLVQDLVHVLKAQILVELHSQAVVDLSFHDSTS